MWELFFRGGPVMLLLLSVSFIGVYIIVQKFLYLKVHYVKHEVAISWVKDKITSIGKEETLLELRTQRKIMLNVLSEAIRLSDLPRDEIQDGVKEATYLEIPKLEKHLPILSAIITIAPILGLLGTVLGLMDIFNVISGGGLGDTQALSGGIAKALITTVTGLGIAIPFIVFYNHLSYKIDSFVLEMEHILYDVIRFCKTNQAVKP